MFLLSSKELEFFLPVNQIVFSFKTVFFLIIFLFMSLKEVDAALLYVTKAKPGPTFFRELGDKGDKAFLILKNTSCFLSHHIV